MEAGSFLAPNLRRAAMSWKAIKVFFRETYDEMFTLIVANLVWFLLCLGVVTIPPATLALYEFVHELACRRDPEYAMLWRGIRKWFRRSYLAAVVVVLSVAVPLVGVLFYLQWSASIGVFGYLLAALCFWCLVFCLLCQLYFLPLLVHQEISVAGAMKRSALLVLLRPWPSLAALGVMVLLWIGLVVPPFLFLPALYASCAAMLKTVALLVGLEEYED